VSNRNVVILSVLVLALAAPSLGVIYFNDFAATKQTWLGRGLYTSNSNYSTLKFGRVAKTEFEMSVMDFDRAGMLNWVQGIYNTYNGGTITNVNQIINDAVKMTLYLTAYDSWEDSGVQPPTIFGHYFWPGVRLSKGQDWVESLATFNNAAGAGFPWHDSAGNALANIYVNKYNTTANMILNATSEQWGAADTIGGGADVYAYDTPVRGCWMTRWPTRP
jgi:hypothetical protein